MVTLTGEYQNPFGNMARSGDRKRPTEVDGQLGIVVRIAGDHGIPTPALNALIAQIHQIERGERPLVENNLNELLI